GHRPRLSLGAGLAYAPLLDAGFVGIPTIVPPQGGRAGDTLRTIVSENKHVRSRVPPMLTLTTQIAEFPSDQVSSLNLLLGATLRKDPTTQAEFFGGVSLGLLNDWVFLSGGVYAGYSSTLAPGVSIGQFIPAGSAVPVSSQLNAVLSAMLYFRLH
ncbi:MAG: hypothetical protein ABI625_24540, partial [bacterium]